MIANVIILLLVFGYCGLVIYWKRTGVLKDSCSSCGSGNGGCGGGCGGSRDGGGCGGSGCGGGRDGGCGGPDGGCGGCN